MAVLGGQQQADKGCGQQHGTQPVDALAGPGLGGSLRRSRPGGQRPCQHSPGQPCERHVQPERPVPGQMLHQRPAQQRADHGRQAIGGAQQALVAGPLFRRKQVGEGQHRQRHEPAAACALQGTRQHQLLQVMAGTTGQGAGQEQADGQQQHGLSAQHIGQPPVQRNHHGGRQQIGREHPGQRPMARQFSGHHGQGGRKNGLVQGRKDERQHEHGEAKPGQVPPTGRGSQRGCGRGRHGRAAARAWVEVTAASVGSGMDFVQCNVLNV